MKLGFLLGIVMLFHQKITHWREKIIQYPSYVQYITVTSLWMWWGHKSPASRPFAESLIQAQIKQNIKAPRYWLLYGEFTCDQWIPRTMGQ